MPLNWGVVISGVMKVDYPKMLYKGDTKHYDHAVVEDEDHESELKNQGYVDFANLEEWTGNAYGVVGSASKGELPVDPKLDELSKKVVDLELQLNVAQTERDENISEVERLSGIIERGKAENIELRKRIEELSSVAQTEPVAETKTTKSKAEQ